jgi:hypothetical protein
MPTKRLQPHKGIGTNRPADGRNSAWMYYDFPGWVFTLAYVAFLLAVVLSWRLIPPER